MLAYAANRPVAGARRSSPNAMLIVVAAHVAVVALVMSARMDLPRRIIEPPLIIDTIKVPSPPEPIAPRARQAPRDSALDQPRQQVPTNLAGTDFTPTPVPSFDGLIGPRLDPQPRVDPTMPSPVKVEARLLTPASELKPPYPRSKLLNEEEAVLKLRLTIDEHGRVIAVAPVGAADPAFLDAARRHLTAHWRYQPASEDGRAVASVTVVTLRFQLDR